MESIDWSQEQKKQNQSKDDRISQPFKTCGCRCLTVIEKGKQAIGRRYSTGPKQIRIPASGKQFAWELRCPIGLIRSDLKLKVEW